MTWVATYANDAMLTLVMLCNFAFPCRVALGA